MLKELYIENLAIIEKAVITFDEKLNVFSGETGAGKSILIGGINAVLGGRVSKDIVRAGAEKAVVTALFGGIPQRTLEKLNEYGYSIGGGFDNELTLTREISSSGNSTARINGKPTTASALREIAEDLIDVHGQNETRLLTSREVQLSLVDSFGDVSAEEYRRVFREFSAVSKKIKSVQKEMELKDEKIEILSAKIEDLRPYKLKKGEEEEVSRELNRLRNIQTLSEMLNTASFSLSGASEQPGAAELVNMCKVSLGQAAEFIPECKALKERLDELSIELDDIRHEITPFMTESSDAEKLPVYEERMSDFLRLRRKYGLSADELADETEKWQSELDALQGGDDFLQKLICDKKELGDRVKKLAAELTKKRKKAAGELSDAIRKELNYLDMPGIRLEFAVNQDKVTISGMDSAEMLIAVNRGEEPKPISKTASGGELSRIMLAVKIADRSRQSDDDATMIFDEIDSGISGRAAQKVGLKLTELSKNRQVLCVTHLAQIAAMADNHLLIEKFHQDGRTFTSVKRICGEERKRELARIISGDEDKLSLANAERLLNAAGSEPG